MTTKHILVLNSGSSSLKFTLLELESGARLAWGLGERLGSDDAYLTFAAPGSSEKFLLPEKTHTAALAKVVEQLQARELLKLIVAVGHRIVQGGDKFTEPTLVDDEALAGIAALGHLAPLHNPVAVLCIAGARSVFPNLPHVAVFDNAFHSTMPEVAYRYAVPTNWYTDYGVRRYGFHGTSHSFVSTAAGKLLGRPTSELSLLTAHLGNGASATAVEKGRSVDTTMGMTPLAGLVMGTRCGSLDPSAALYMARQVPGGAAEIDEVLNRKSGMFGLSNGLSNDMRTLLAAEKEGNREAKLAVDVFCYRLAVELAGLRVALSAFDALIFTGGIGEHSAEIRARVVAQLGFLDLHIDAERNSAHGRSTNGDISTGKGPRILVIPTDEEWLIASQTYATTHPQ